MNLKGKLVDDWNKAHKWLSMQIMALTASLPIAWINIPQEWKDAVPRWAILGITVLCLFGMSARIIKQKNLHPTEPPPSDDKPT